MGFSGVCLLFFHQVAQRKTAKELQVVNKSGKTYTVEVIPHDDGKNGMAG